MKKTGLAVGLILSLAFIAQAQAGTQEDYGKVSYGACTDEEVAYKDLADRLKHKAIKYAKQFCKDRNGVKRGDKVTHYTSISDGTGVRVWCGITGRIECAD